jgi:hypothetical protein
VLVRLVPKAPEVPTVRMALLDNRAPPVMRELRAPPDPKVLKAALDPLV